MTENIRVQNDPDYAKWILEIGNGIGEAEDFVKVPQTMLLSNEDELIKFVYDKKSIQWPTSKKRVILTVSNAATFDLNEKVI